MNDSNSVAHDRKQSATQPHKMQISVRTTLAVVTLIALWCAVFSSPFMLDVALIATSLILAIRWVRRRRWILLLILGIAPASIAGWSLPSILSDPGLATSAVKRELLWSSFMVGVMIAIVFCGFLAALNRRRFVAVSVLALMFSGASVAMHWYSVNYYHFNQIDFSRRIVGGASLRVESLRGVGRVYLHWKHTRANAELNYFRSNETTVFGQGGRVRGLRAFLTYLRSTRDEGDHIFGPSLTLQLPYWMLATVSGLLVFPWPLLWRGQKNRREYRATD